MTASPAGSARQAINAACEAEWSRLVALLARHTGDLALAEDSVQEAFEIALKAWLDAGVPDNPGAWLWTTARRRAIDALRRRGALATKYAVAGVSPPGNAADLFDQIERPIATALDDDVLGLIFACCHPALAPEARIALTLRAVGGLSPPQIARAFLLPQRTLDQRLVRARRKIRDARIPMTVPPDHELPERLGSVFTVIFLIFNEGFATSAGPSLTRVDLCEEAIRLGRMLLHLMPDEPDVIGLVALMLLHDARRQTRVSPEGALVPLDAQDRSRWNHRLVTEGTSLLDQAMRMRRSGPYQIQAAIAALHATATDADTTDWPQIAALYAALGRWNRSPVIELNRAVAVGMAHGPDAGLALLASLEADDRLRGYYLLPATRADFERRAGRPEHAARAYRRALQQVTNPVERAYLKRRLAEVEPVLEAGKRS